MEGLGRTVAYAVGRGVREDAVLVKVGETVGLLDERVREDLEEGGVVDVLDVDKVEDLASVAVSDLPHSSSTSPSLTSPRRSRG